MQIQSWNHGLILLVLCGACAQTPKSVVPATDVASSATLETAPSTPAKSPASPGSDYVLICKAKKSRFHFDWTAAAVGKEQIDQNLVRYKFRSATRPAGEKGENLKVGECGWAGRALASGKKESSEVIMNSLSEEATQRFYKMRTGKVFKLPVRRSKTGMVGLPRSEVSVVQ